MPQKTFQYIATAYIAMHCVVANAQNWGQFIGTVETRWIDDRRMELLKDFAYTDPENNTWLAPKGSIVDGASIPKIAWSVIGGPYVGNYRAASVIHDVACDKRTRSWQATHKAFYTAMNASGVDQKLSKIMYAAVYHFGPRWGLLEKISIPKITSEELSKKIDAINKTPGQSATITQQGTIADYKAKPSIEGIVTLHNTDKKTTINNVEIEIREVEPEISEKEFIKMSGLVIKNDLSIQEIEKLQIEK